MRVEIFSILDYYGNKNNGSEMLPLYLEHYTNSFPESKINIYMSNYPKNYNGYEVPLLNKYGCNIDIIELDKTEKYYDYRLTKEVRNYLKKEKEFRDSVWKESKADWVILCDIDEILMISDDELKNEDDDIIQFEGYYMKRYNKKSKFNQLTYGFYATVYDKPCIFRPSIKEMNFSLGQHSCKPTTKKIKKSNYKLLHYRKKFFDLSPISRNIPKIELVRTDIKKEVDDNYITLSFFQSNILIDDKYVNKKINISKEGIWIDNVLEEHHYTDYQLCEELVKFLNEENAQSIVDFGCGLGSYVNCFRENNIEADGYDGNPRTNMHNKYCNTLDLSKPINIKKYNWVMSFEVGEHIPKECEDVFIDNMHRSNKDGIILTWAPIGQPGFGHINCQDINYIINKITKLGYTLDVKQTNELRESCELPWIGLTLIVLRKNK